MDTRQILIAAVSQADRSALTDILGDGFILLDAADDMQAAADSGTDRDALVLALLERIHCAEKLAVLERRMARDSLTGLLNRDAARAEITARLLEQPDARFALALVDLDDFKIANDKWGHPFGDQVLQETARRLLGSIRNTDLACRVGGDEFLLFWEFSENADKIAERVVHDLCGPFGDYNISASVGVALTEDAGRSCQALYKAADTALYDAKRAGKRQCRFYGARQSR